MATQTATSRIKSLLSGIGNAVKAGRQNVTNFLNKPIEVRNPVAQKAVQVVTKLAQATPIRIVNQARQDLSAPVQVSPWVANTASRLATATPIRLAQPTIKAVQDWKAKPMGPISQRLKDSGVLNPWTQAKKLSVHFAPPDLGKKFTKDFTPIIGQPAAESIGYGLQGATSLTPFRLANITNSGYRTKLKEAAPVTARQQKSERIGRMLYGMAITSPLGGPKPIMNVVSRGIQGSTLNLGMDTVEKIIGEGRLPTWKEAGNAAMTGAENSWMLAFTNFATDTILGAGAKYLPGLNKLVGENTTTPLKILGNVSSMNLSNPTKVKILTTAGMRLFSRALAEVPMENTLFTAMEGFTPKEKADFTQRWWNNLPGNIAGNLLFAGLQFGGGGTYNWNKKEIDGAVEALKKTLSGMKPGYARLDLGMGKDDKLSTNLQKAKPRYNYGEKAFIPKFKSDVDKALYITAQTKKSASDDSYRAYLKNVIGMTDEEITLAGKEVRDFVKSEAKVAEGGTQAKPEIIVVPDMGVKALVPLAEKVEPVAQGGQRSLNALEVEIKKVGDAIGQVRRDLSKESDPQMRETLNQHRKQLEAAYADLKNLQEGKGYVPVESTTIAPTPKQAVESTTQPQTSGKKATTEGFTTAGEANMKATRKLKVKQAVAEIKPKGIFARIKSKVNEVFYPIKNLENNSREAVYALDAAKKYSDNEARLTAQMFHEISRNSGVDPILELKLMQYSQKPTAEMADLLEISKEDITKGTDLINASKAFNDKIFAQAKEAGVDINYLKDHLLQIYKQSDAEIAATMKAMSASGKPGFSKKRSIKDYYTAINELKLTPKYTTFGQVNAEMQNQLGYAIANKQYVDILKANNQLLPASKAPPGWEAINSPGFPKLLVKYGNNKSVELPYFAPPEQARFINSFFGGQPQHIVSQALQAGASLASHYQQAALSSVPGPTNMFSISQYLKDVATGIGEISTLSPRKGVTRIWDSSASMVRWFIPGSGPRFDKKNNESIKQMASVGHGYGGIQNWKANRKNILDADNVLQKAIKTGGNIWMTLMENPTFKHMMWQRKVSQFNLYRDTFIRAGVPKETAIKMAGAELSNYDGVADSLGRSKDMENFFTMSFMAPKYREGVFGSLTNIGKGFWNFKDKTYASSRALGVGLIATYAIYDKLNQDMNDGKHLWENPKGKELALVIPKTKFDPSANPNEYYNIPWMPGFTATPRAIIGGTSALLQGDTPTASKEFGKFGSILAQTYGEATRNEDFFGRQIYDPSKPALPQQAKYMLTSGLPQWMQEVGTYNKNVEAGKNPSKTLAVLRAMEIPIREGKFSSQYFDIQDKVLKNQSVQVQKDYAALHPNKELWETVTASDQNDSATTEEKMGKAFNRVKNNGELYMVEREIAQKNGKLMNQEIDPIYTVPMETALHLLRYNSLPPANADKKAIGKAYPEIFDLMDLRTAYYEKHPLNNTTNPNRPIASERAQKLMDEGNWTDPEVQAYLNASTFYNNQEREKMGIPAVAGFSPWGTKAKKITIPKLPIRKTPLLEVPKKFTPIRLKSLSSATKAPKIAAPPGIKSRVSSYTPIKIKSPTTARKMASTLGGIGHA